MFDRYQCLRDSLQRQVGQRESLQKRLTVVDARATRLEDESITVSDAIEIVQAATETRRQELRDRVESLVTRGLRAVFEREDYEFAFNVSLKGGRFGVVPVLRSKFGDRDLETGIVDGHGGGVADLVSFLLRVIVLSLARPRVAPLMVLDESFRHVSPEFLRGVGTLLRELNTSAGIQFLLITHKPELLDAADRIYRASLENGATTFTLEHATRDVSYHQRPDPRAKRMSDATVFDGEDLITAEADAESTESQGGEAKKEQRRNKVRRRARRKKK